MKFQIGDHEIFGSSNFLNRKTLIVVFIVTLTSNSLLAGEWEVSGNIGVQSRYFLDDPLIPTLPEGTPVTLAQGDGFETSLSVQPELRWYSDSGNSRFSFIGFGRTDEQDNERSHFDIRELYWAYESNNWDFNIGLNKVFWGVTESRHLVDVINQTDLVEDLDQEDKLGQAMINLNFQQDWGRLSLFVLPHFRERTFAGKSGRFRGFAVVDDDLASYESAAEELHTDLALRYSHYFGNMDIGVYLFEGTNREPILNQVITDFPELSFPAKVAPYYEQMTQMGLDLQYTLDAWLLKLEVLSRRADSGNFQAAVAGFEYTYYQILDSALDLGILMEYQYDGRSDSAPFTSSDDDIFLGARLAWNDINDSSLLAGVVVDSEHDSLFFSIEAERRFADNISAELRIRIISDADKDPSLVVFSQDDYAQLSLSWHF